MVMIVLLSLVAIFLPKQVRKLLIDSRRLSLQNNQSFELQSAIEFGYSALEIARSDVEVVCLCDEPEWQLLTEIRHRMNQRLQGPITCQN